MSNNLEIKSPLLFSPAMLSNVFEQYEAKGFNIPIYQRLYAWTEKEIVTLLNDFYNTFKTTTAHDKEYFIGNLTLNYNELSKCYDIIDGQQRITTLWLVGLVLNMRETTANWDNFLVYKNEPTLRFTAREDDNDFLKKLITTNHENSNTNNNLESINKLISKNRNVNLNQMMINAINCIDSFLNQTDKDNCTSEFSQYIFEKVKMASVFLPKSIDLNKYFEDMNNRGLQLESHHILKAYFLKDISTQLQENYAKVWDAVSQMNQYLEYGFEGTLIENRRNIISNFDAIYLSNAKNKQPYNDDKIFNKSEIESENELRFLILKAIETDYKPEKEKEETYKERVISIINFPQFLLHCLNIYNNEGDVKKYSYDDKKLIETFNSAKIYNEAESFINFLFKARISFDKYFIKSTNTNEGVKWETRFIFKKEKEEDFERKKHFEGEVVQLQSMLNASLTSNLWLPKALIYTMKNKVTEIDFITILKEIDKSNNSTLPSISELNKGTQTSRYWFFKLDYLLWKKWVLEENETPNFPEIPNLKDKIRNFQFRDNRSVEHVQPQNPTEGIDWKPSESNQLSISKIKDQFGNLALISIRSNSSYNNQLPKLKKDDFIKRSKNWGIESLKLLDSYSSDDWTIEKMNEHQNSMYKLLEEDYKQ
jgi:uncharacterized protein with ParB-like and HNH nuclease domain